MMMDGRSRIVKVGIAVSMIMTSLETCDAFAPFSFPHPQRQKHSLATFTTTTTQIQAMDVDDSPGFNHEDLPKRNLYEILGAERTATRDQLKKNYVIMAKKSHPDANIGQKEGDSQQQKNVADFSEVAAAWEILSDPKQRRKYDRALKAAEFSAIAQKYANDKLEEAVPVVAKALDDVAFPFLRRSTATTWAVAEAAARGVSNIMPNKRKKKKLNEEAEERSTIGRAFWDAVEAGKRVGRAIDSIELNEKSSALEERAISELKKIQEIDRELATVTENRLLSTLRSSNFALSSTESFQVLDKLTTPGEEVPHNLMDRTIFRKSLEEEIVSLRNAEYNFSEKLDEYKDADGAWNNLLSQQEGIRDDLIRSKEAEREALKALATAQHMVAEAKARLVTTSNALRDVEEQVKRNAQEMDRVTAHLAKKQERVRLQLRKRLENTLDPVELEAYSQYNEDGLKQLRRRELQLLDERIQIETMVGRLQSRASKLNTRAIALEKWEKTGQKNGISAPTGSE